MSFPIFLAYKQTSGDGIKKSGGGPPDFPSLQDVRGFKQLSEYKNFLCVDVRISGIPFYELPARSHIITHQH